jgi:hypothetical protein
MSDVDVTKLTRKDKVAYQIVEDGVSWWVTGLVAAVKEDNTVDVYPESILFEGFPEEGTVNVSKSSIVPTRNFTLWASRRFWYFGGPRGKQTSSALWMERVVDVTAKCTPIEAKDLLILGGITWLVLGFYRYPGGDTRLALLKEPHILDHQENVSTLMRRTGQAQCFSILGKFEKVPKVSSAGLTIFEGLEDKYQEIITRIYDSFISEVHAHICKKNKTLGAYGEILKLKQRFVTVPDSISLSKLMSMPTLDPSEPVVALPRLSRRN